MTGVLDGWLARRAWLVGGKCTYADLMYIPWAQIARMLTKKHGIDLDKYPSYAKWLKGMEVRESVHQMLNVMQRLSTHLE